jgi:hypothetical protein
MNELELEVMSLLKKQKNGMSDLDMFDIIGNKFTDLEITDFWTTLRRMMWREHITQLVNEDYVIYRGKRTSRKDSREIPRGASVVPVEG